MSSRTRGSGRPHRPVRNTAQRLELLVFVEGQATEVQYLTEWRRLYRTTVSIKFADEFGTPMTLVRRAIDQHRTDTRNARRGRGRAHDQIWCVFDQDEHPQVPEALVLARDHGVRVAFSNPCIELWFALHFQDQTAYLTRGAAQALAKSFLSCDKNLSAEAKERLLNNYDSARARAIALDEKHESDGSPMGSNPSSGLWRLIDEVKNAPSPESG